MNYIRDNTLSAFTTLFTFTLDKIAERQRLDGSDSTIDTSSRKVVTILGSLRCPLQRFSHGLSSSLICLLCGILHLALQKISLTLRFSHVLNANMNTLLDDTSVDELVDTNTDCRLGDIENDSSTSVVELVGHTLVHGGVGKNVNIVSDLHTHEVLGKVNRSMLSELLREHVARASADSE